MTIYNAPVNLRTTDDVALRLRLTAAVRGKAICVLVTEALGTALPSADELAQRLRDGAEAEATS
jgi:hypothetical protein